MEYSGNSLPRCGIWWQLAAQVWNIVALHCPGVGIWWQLATQVWKIVAIGYPGVENSGDWLPKYERQSAAQGLKSVEGLAICMS
jgi:hypothetical protein